MEKIGGNDLKRNVRLRLHKLIENIINQYNIDTYISLRSFKTSLEDMLRSEKEDSIYLPEQKKKLKYELKLKLSHVTEFEVIWEKLGLKTKQSKTQDLNANVTQKENDDARVYQELIKKIKILKADKESKKSIQFLKKWLRKAVEKSEQAVT